MDIFDILISASKLGASDVHINVKYEPIAKVNGKFVKIINQLLSKLDTKKMVTDLVGKEPDYLVETSSVVAVGAGDKSLALSYILKN